MVKLKLLGLLYKSGGGGFDLVALQVLSFLLFLSLNLLLPKSERQTILQTMSVTPDDFTRQRETP